MNNKIDILLIIIFFIPIFFGFIHKFNSHYIKEDIYSFEKNILLLISGIICLFWADRGIVMNRVMSILNDYSIFYIFSSEFPTIYFMIIFVLTFTIVYYLLKILVKSFNAVFVYSLIDVIGKVANRNGVFVRRMLGGLFKIPKGIIYAVVSTFIISVIPFQDYDTIRDIRNSELYNYIRVKAVDPIRQSNIIAQLPRILNNSLKIRIIDNDKHNNSEDTPDIKNNSNIIIYYNGVTLSEGVRSNYAINSKADEITDGLESNEDKAYAIYQWIGSNIKYDDQKAEDVLSGDTSKKSGAISAFETRKGICLDYACLYVAMCRQENIKVRIITGKGYNGREWVSHAWNQVYVSESAKWIDVDPTFSVAGNYFGNTRFNNDHRAEDIAGEW